MSFLESAIALALRGFKVFPCVPGQKRAIEKGWQEKATDDLAAIEAAWKKHPNANIGVFTRGGVIVDVDLYKGAALSQLAALGELPETFTVGTARSGQHLYYSTTDDFGNGRGDLPPGIDIRGRGGLVLGPGSVFEGGSYTIIKDLPIAPLPEWLAGHLRKVVRKSGAPSVEPENVDTPENIECVASYLTRAPIAVAGENGNNTTYSVCARVFDYAVSFETAIELLQPWNERCDPPWSDDELRRIAGNAANYHQNGRGASDPRAGFEPFIDDRTFNDNPFIRSLVVYDDSESDVAELAPRPWLASGKLMRGKITLLVAPGASGKSLLTLQWACALALGPDASGNTFCGLGVRERTKTVVINAEDDTHEMRMRLAAIMKKWPLARDEIRRNVILQSSQDSGAPSFIVAKKTGRHGAVTETETVQALIDYCRANGIGAVVVDPFVDTHEASENDNAEIQRVMRIYRRLAADANVAVLLVHHSRKPAMAGSDNYAGSADAGRGASAVVNAARIGVTLFRMSEKDGERYGVDRHKRHRYVRLDDSKANLHEASALAQWFQLESVEIANGEKMGVMVPATVSDKNEANGVAILSAMATCMNVGERLTVEAACKRLIQHTDYIERSETWAREAITDACSISKPESGGKYFAWERGMSKKGGTIEIRAAK